MRNLILSPAQLDVLNRCPREYFFRYSLQRATVQENKAMEEGSFLHVILEKYYTQRKALNVDLDSIVEFARMEALKSPLTIEDTESLIELFLEYRDHHQNETWEIEEIEKPLTKVLLEDQRLDLRIVLKGKADLLIRTQGIPAIVDHKKISRNKQMSPRNNQIVAYCWGFDRFDFIYNQLGTQKSLKREDKFKRPYFNISQLQIEEWQEQTIYNAFEAVKFHESKFWPARFYACWNPITGSKCDFHPVCEQRESAWENILFESGLFQKRPEFDLMGDADAQ